MYDDVAVRAAAVLGEAARAGLADPTLRRRVAGYAAHLPRCSDPLLQEAGDRCREALHPATPPEVALTDLLAAAELARLAAA